MYDSNASIAIDSISDDDDDNANDNDEEDKIDAYELSDLIQDLALRYRVPAN